MEVVVDVASEEAKPIHAPSRRLCAINMHPWEVLDRHLVVDG